MLREMCIGSKSRVLEGCFAMLREMFNNPLETRIDVIVLCKPPSSFTAVFCSSKASEAYMRFCLAGFWTWSNLAISARVAAALQDRALDFNPPLLETSTTKV
jgi:hypothetical protein